MKLKLACIPAHNEESTIADIIRSASSHVDQVVVCDDGSSDNTADVARRAGATVVSHPQNKGYGAAIASLFDYARRRGADMMVTLDGDGQHNPDQIPLLADTLRRHNIDVVIGSRFLNEGDGVPGYRKYGIKIITFTTNLGSGIKVSDSQSGFRAYSKAAIYNIHPTEEGMSVSTEILLKISSKQLSLAEVPITVSYDGSPAHNPVSHGVSVLANTIKYTSLKHPLKFFGISGLGFLVVGFITAGTFLDAYLNEQTVFFGSLLASVVLILLGAILCMTSIILFSMANLSRSKL